MAIARKKPNKVGKKKKKHVKSVKKKKIKLVKKKKKCTAPVNLRRKANGQVQKGSILNPDGRPKDTCFTDELHTAMRRVERKKGKTVMEHFCEQAFEDTTVVVSLLRKLCPDLKAVQIESIANAMTDERAAQIQKELKERFAC